MTARNRILAPRGLARALVVQLNREFNRITDAAEVWDKETSETHTFSGPSKLCASSFI